MESNDWMLLGLVLFAVACIVAAVILAGRVKGHKQILLAWCEARGFRIIEYKRRYLFRGPFMFISSTGQSVFRIRVYDRGNKEQAGYVRIGGFWGLGDYVKVKWDCEDFD